MGQAPCITLLEDKKADVFGFNFILYYVQVYE